MLQFALHHRGSSFWFLTALQFPSPETSFVGPERTFITQCPAISISFYVQWAQQEMNLSSWTQPQTSICNLNLLFRALDKKLSTNLFPLEPLSGSHFRDVTKRNLISLYSWDWKLLLWLENRRSVFIPLFYARDLWFRIDKVRVLPPSKTFECDELPSNKSEDRSICMSWDYCVVNRNVPWHPHQAAKSLRQEWRR